MIFKQLFDQDTSTYTYLLGDEDSRKAIIIDPVLEHLDLYLNLFETLNLKLKYTLDTHVHADHITCSGKLREQTGAESVLHKDTKADCASKKVSDGDELQFGSHTIQVIHTPGHTPDSVSYLVGDRVFTGDALLINGCGRTDFQNGSAEKLWNSITEKLFNLPDETLVYPGHDYNKRFVSSIAEQKALNPRLSGKSKKEFIEIMKNLNLPKPKYIDIAVPANEKCGLETASQQG